jgi:hypothetical protein
MRNLPADPSLAQTPDEVRCLCGQLIARVVHGGIELKCKRCRRLVTIPFSHIQGMPVIKT